MSEIFKYEGVNLFPISIAELDDLILHYIQTKGIKKYRYYYANYNDALLDLQGEIGLAETKNLKSFLRRKFFNFAILNQKSLGYLVDVVNKSTINEIDENSYNTYAQIGKKHETQEFVIRTLNYDELETEFIDNLTFYKLDEDSKTEFLPNYIDHILNNSIERDRIFNRIANSQDKLRNFLDYPELNIEENSQLFRTIYLPTSVHELIIGKLIKIQNIIQEQIQIETNEALKYTHPFNVENINSSGIFKNEYINKFISFEKELIKNELLSDKWKSSKKELIGVLRFLHEQGFFIVKNFDNNEVQRKRVFQFFEDRYLIDMGDQKRPSKYSVYDIPDYKYLL